LIGSRWESDAVSYCVGTCMVGWLIFFFR
jgi:hypothetical protein